MNCDNCPYYIWTFDFCKKHDCYVDEVECEVTE